VADVQLKHGYVAIANRLFEALIEAPFHARQLRILITLVRLTYGWRRRSVQLTELELAEYSGALSGDSRRAGGSFRSDLAELVKEGVVTRLEAGKRGLMAWALNKDYESWGRFSVPHNRLLAKWNAKPVSSRADEAAIDDEVARKQATSNEGNWPESGPQPSANGTGTGPHSGPIPGHTGDRGRAPNSSEVHDSQSVKPSESHRKPEKDITTTAATRARAAAAAGDSPDAELLARYAGSLADATNRAIADRWGLQDKQIRPFGITLEIARGLLLRQIPIELATSTIADKVRTGSFNSVPFSVKYFLDAIVEAYQDDIQRRRERDIARGPELVGAYLERERRELEQQDAYVAARAPIVAAWRADPDNAEQLAAIEADALAEFPTANSFNAPARAVRVVQLIAAAAGFPEFDTWQISAKAS
jgi:phage replication O-like protein O